MHEMTESGIDWIGLIPNKWNIYKIKNIGKYINGYAFKPEDWSSSGIPIIRIQDLTGSNDNPNFYDGEIDKKYRVSNGDILVSWAASLNAFIWNKEDGWLNQHIFKAIPNENIVSKEYFIWILKVAMENMNNDNKHGIVMQHVTLDVFNNFKIVLPSLDEQKRISAFLTKRISKIDNLIEKTRDTIENYKKYRKLLITNAVTHGVDNNLEKIDSGIKWIGEIPKNWRIIKLKYLFQEGSLKIGPFGSALTGRTLSQGAIKIYNQANLIENNFDLSRHYIDENTYNELRNYEIIPGDILFSMMGTVGKCKEMPEGFSKGIMDSHLIKARLNNHIILNKFFEYVYDKDYSNVVIEQLLYYSNGTIMNGLNSTILKNISIAVPDINEQLKIVNYLNRKISEIDIILSNKEKMVLELEQYKKSLIYEYVTGKKEVV